MADHLHAFLDTNTLMEFQTFDEVDWGGFLASPQVTLVLAPVILSELDKHKSDPANNRRRKRARTLLSKLRQLISSMAPGQPVMVKENVSLLDLPYEPQIDWVALQLDANNLDDRLIAAVCDFQTRNVGVHIAIVTNDFGLTRKAQARSIQVFDPERTIQRYEPPSEEAVKIQQLERRLQEHEQRRPNLEVRLVAPGVTDAVWRIKPQVPSKPWTSDQEVSEEVEIEGRSCRRLVESSVRVYGERYYKPYLAAVGRYERKLYEYLRNKRWLEAGWRLDCRFEIENVGSAPATDIELEVLVPQGWEAVLTSHIERASGRFHESQRPERPEPPRPPTPMQLATLGLFESRPPNLSAFFPPIIARNGPRTPQTSAAHQTVWIEHPKLRAKECWRSGQVTLLLPPLRNGGGAQLDFNVHADEYMSPEVGQIHVVVTGAIE